MMQNELHVVIGGGGAIGRATIDVLKNKNLDVIAVERSREVEGIATRKADVLNPAQLEEAMQGATHVYLCAGLPYDTRIWQTQWPLLMRNVIDACSKINARIIFFDNVYLYGHPLANPFDEDHPQNANTAKGAVRKQIADMLLEAHGSGLVKAVIARSADFYGPQARNSTLYLGLLDRMLEGKRPQSIYNLDIPHTWAYTIDNGRAFVTLALDEATYGKAWHLPVGEPLSIREAIQLFNEARGTDLQPQTIPPKLLPFLSLFIKPLKAAREMLYQFNEPYVMSSAAFMGRYPDFKVTSYEDGMKAMAESFRNTAH